jgi:hypothetical protein
MLRRIRFMRSASWLLTTTALVAVGCGDDTTETTSTTGQGGEGSGGDDPQGSTGQGTPTGSSSSQSSSSGNPQSSSSDASSSSSGGDGGNGAGGAGGSGGSEGVCGNGQVEPGEECDGGEFCSDECEITPGCGNGVTEDDEACDDANDDDLDGCRADCTPTPEEIVCDALGTGACTVDAGNDAKLLIGDVLLPNTVLRGGQVSVNTEGVITCVGCDCEGEEAGATVVTCPEGAISPGLINTHEHITYAHNDPANDSGERYEHRHDWRTGNGGHTIIDYDSGGSADQVRWGELRFLISGATSLVGSGSASGFLRNLDRNDQEGLGIPPVHFETFPLNDANGNTETSGCGYSDIDSQQSIALDLAYLPHVSEGIDRAARNEFICVSGSPGEDLLQHQSSFIHGIGLIPSDYRDMATDGTSLIWSPRSNIVLYGNTAEVTVAARLGVNIALGTDWIVSGSHNMFRELACAASLNDDYFDGFFTRRELWKMVTVNAARSLGVEKVLGTLAVGTVADISIFDGSESPDYGAVVDGDGDGVHLVLRGGEPMFGDETVMNLLPDVAANCDEIDICGSDKTICVMPDLGRTYAQLRTAAGNLYGPTYCEGDPVLDDEPSCLPRRPESVDGSTVYTGIPDANDEDGDGIDDDDDNCPNVFNPIRPVDDGEQGDEDGDDVGDVCDPCPLEADVDLCTGIDPADEDSDGIPNFFDNCPYDANTSQNDADDDDKGDACDACPDAPNPGFAPCATTIYDVKEGDVEGPVFLPDVLVTACAPDTGFFVQYHEDDAAYDGAENSGLYVYDPGVVCGTDVTPGDRLDLSGTTSVFFDQIQLGFASYDTVAEGEPAPTPIVLTTAQCSQNPPNVYEGILARVEGVEVTDNAPAPGPGDSNPTGEFVVEGNLRIDNFVFPAMAVPSEGTTFQSITGVLMLKNGNQKMDPRNAGDLEQ